MFSKLAAKWPHAMRAWPDFRFGCADDGARPVDDPFALKNQLQNVGGDVGIDKPSAKKVPLRSERPFHMPDDNRRYADVTAAQDPGLGRRVEQLIRFYAGRIF